MLTRIASCSSNSLAIVTLACLTVSAHAQLPGYGNPSPVFSSSLFPESLFAADLNGDGLEDLLLASSGGDELGWFEGQAGGAFLPLQVIDSGFDSATHVSAGDLDGDGDLDVVVCADALDNFFWLENLGSGQFGPKTVLGNETTAGLFATVADIDGDGDNDIVATTELDVIAFINAGGGMFSSATVLTSAMPDAHSIAASDMDGDGDLDLVVPSATNNKVGWLENLGAGLFGFVQPVSASTENLRVALAADFDGDGDQDIFYYSNALSLKKVGWYENGGSGTFVAQHLVTTLGLNVATAAVEDVDGDGDPDVVIGTFPGGTISWFENQSSGQTWVERQLLNSPGVASSLVVKDFDGDGVAELVLSARSQHKVVVRRSAGGPPFAASETLSVPALWVGALAAVDLDADGDLEVAMAAKNEYELSTFESLGQGGFGLPAVVAAGNVGQLTSQYLEAVDVDGDGATDLVVKLFNPVRIAWFRNLGTGQLSAENSFGAAVTGGSTATSFLFEDLDQDGNKDLITSSSSQYYWAKSLGGGAFGPRQTLLNFFVSQGVIDFGDIDGDGDLDALMSVAGSQSIQWIENTGQLQFASITTLATGVFPPRHTELADLNGDGELDIVYLGGEAPGGTSAVSWLRSLGSGAFAPAAVITPVGSATESLVVADYDGDLDLDLLTYTRPGAVAELTWLENLGGGLFAANLLGAETDESSLLTVLDRDGDGDLDILTGAIGQAYFFENTQGPFDCNGNGISDLQDILSGFSADCNGNQIPDECELLLSAADQNADGILDACQPHVLAVTPDASAWFEAVQLTLHGTGFDVSQPAEVIFLSASTSAAGDTPLPAVVIDSTTATVQVPAGHASGAGPQTVILRQGAVDIAMVAGWTSLPSMTTSLAGTAATGLQLEIETESTHIGSISIYFAPAQSASPFPLGGFHSLVGLHPATAFQAGVASLANTPSFSWSFNPGSLPAGVTVYCQGLAVEVAPSGTHFSLTELRPLLIP